MCEFSSDNWMFNSIPMAAMVAFLFMSACSNRPVENTPMLFNESNSAAPFDEGMIHNRFINWRPADGSTVTLNPPRFNWPYEPTIFPETISEDTRRLPVRRYRFQVALEPGFDKPLVDIEETPFNFYNTLAMLPGGQTVYWRVGYYGTGEDDSGAYRWQPVRSFKIAADAVRWDRSGLEKPDFVSTGHPRIIFTPERMDLLRGLHAVSYTHLRAHET